MVGHTLDVMPHTFTGYLPEKTTSIRVERKHKARPIPTKTPCATKGNLTSANENFDLCIQLHARVVGFKRRRRSTWEKSVNVAGDQIPHGVTHHCKKIHSETRGFLESASGRERETRFQIYFKAILLLFLNLTTMSAMSIGLDTTLSLSARDSNGIVKPHRFTAKPVLEREPKLLQST